MRRPGHALRGLLLSVLVSAAIAELAAACGLRLLGHPIYWTDGQRPPRTEREPWGAWGVPDSNARLVGPCFDVGYRFNGVGARDRDRQPRSPGRWIVLGDSFVEGYGIEQGERFTDLLEARLGLEFANFGSTGNFGPLQYLLLYRLLAGRFEHGGGDRRLSSA